MSEMRSVYVAHETPSPKRKFDANQSTSPLKGRAFRGISNYEMSFCQNRSGDSTFEKAVSPERKAASTFQMRAVPFSATSTSRQDFTQVEDAPRVSRQARVVLPHKSIAPLRGQSESKVQYKAYEVERIAKVKPFEHGLPHVKFTAETTSKESFATPKESDYVTRVTKTAKAHKPYEYGKSRNLQSLYSANYSTAYKQKD